MTQGCIVTISDARVDTLRGEAMFKPLRTAFLNELAHFSLADVVGRTDIVLPDALQ